LKKKSVSILFLRVVCLFRACQYFLRGYNEEIHRDADVRALGGDSAKKISIAKNE
jgi:hypothetical protein